MTCCARSTRVPEVVCGDWFLANFGLSQVKHLLPANDLRMHDGAANCWCQPETNEDGLVVHNSLDGREDFETGRRLVS